MKLALITKPDSLRLGLVALVAGCLLSCTTSTVAQKKDSVVDAYIVVDYHSRKIVSAHNAWEQRPVASLTKIATTLVALDWAEATGADLKQLVVVPGSAALIGGANPMKMQPGDQISISDALYSAIAGSDNVAAQTVARHVGGDLLRRRGTQGDPVAKFVTEMNNLAKIKGARGTKFVNPHGMDQVKPVPYSTAADVARLCVYAMSKPGFTFHSSQEKRKVTYFRQGEKREFMVKNTNKLLGKHRIDGIKTGLTNAAGPCVAISADRPTTRVETPQGIRLTPHRLVVVVLGARDRFGIADSLLRRGWEKYDAWIAGGRRIASSEELLDVGNSKP